MIMMMVGVGVTAEPFAEAGAELSPDDMEPVQPLNSKATQIIPIIKILIII